MADSTLLELQIRELHLTRTLFQSKIFITQERDLIISNCYWAYCHRTSGFKVFLTHNRVAQFEF